MDTVKTRIQAEDKTAKNQEREKQQRQQQQGGLFRRSFTGSTMISLQQQQQQVLETTDAKIEDGGSGTFYIYLKNKRKIK